MKSPLLTVVIPAKNEENYIASTLTALVNQTSITPLTPIYIADANSTDNTKKIVESFKDRLNISIIKGGLPSAGRNHGAYYAHSKYILFLDADIELGENTTLEKALSLAEMQDLDLVTTYIKTKDANIADKMFWSLHGAVSRSKLLGAFGAGMFLLMKKTAFDQIGGFDESIALGEDWELTHHIAPDKFSISKTYIYTTNRRFKSQGYLKTIGQYIMVATSKHYRKGRHEDYFDINFN